MPSRKTKPRNTVLERVSKSLKAVAASTTPKNVHFFRTSCRRLEAVAELGKGDGARVLRKLSKRLDKPRRLAGRVRDLDVQLDMLRHLHFDGDHESRRRLRADLQDARARAARKLSKSLDAEAVASLRRRLAKAARADFANGPAQYREHAWQQAQALLAALPEEFPSVEPKNLHRL